MDDQERGQLFVQQEHLQKQVLALRARLVQAGKELEQIGRELQSRPEMVTFSNAPGSLGSMPAELAFSTRHSYEWGIAHRVEEAAQMIQELRERERELQNVQRRLKPS